MIDPSRLDDRPSGTGRVRAGVSGFVQDTVELAELQGQLFAADLRRSKGKIAWGIVLLGLSAVLALAVLTTLLMACGGGLASLLEWPPWAGQLLASGVGLLLLVIATFLGIRLLLKSGEPLSRSSAELRENWSAVKTALARTGGPPTTDTRSDPAAYEDLRGRTNGYP